MAVLHNPESAYTKEMASWEQFPSEWTVGGLQPGRPYVKREFPKMLYKAQRGPNGKWACVGEQPPRHMFRDDNEWDRACQDADRFTASCQQIVKDEREYDRARDEGWRESPPEAVEFQFNLEKEISTAAAERNFQDRNMSEEAKAEAAEAEAAHFGHLPEIPEKPKARRKKVTRRKRS